MNSATKSPVLVTRTCPICRCEFMPHHIDEGTCSDECEEGIDDYEYRMQATAAEYAAEDRYEAMNRGF